VRHCPPRITATAARSGGAVPAAEPVWDDRRPASAAHSMATGPLEPTRTESGRTQGSRCPGPSGPAHRCGSGTRPPARSHRPPAAYRPRARPARAVAAAPFRLVDGQPLADGLKGIRRVGVTPIRHQVLRRSVRQVGRIEHHEGRPGPTPWSPGTLSIWRPLWTSSGRKALRCTRGSRALLARALRASQP
jgi:hypothetical protein